MPGPASPIDIATARQASSSPRNQQSNLTSQLQQPHIDVHQSEPTRMADTVDIPIEKGRQESTTSMLGTTPSARAAFPSAAISGEAATTCLAV
ncbi:hypothetical protein MRB53_040316 [Persea americana]|nr:hypothetical protein MRB53_040316 [Persea americana]